MISGEKSLKQDLETADNKHLKDLIFDYSVDCMVLANHQGFILDWNNSCEQTTGISRQDAVDRMLWEIISYILPVGYKGYTELKMIVHDIFIHMMPQKITHPAIHRITGEYKILQAQFFPVHLPGKTIMCTICRELTGVEQVPDNKPGRYRERLEFKTRELIVSRQRLISLSNNLPGGVIYQLTEAECSIPVFTYISAQFTDLFGIGIPEVLKDNSLFYKAIIPEDRLRFMEYFTDNEELSHRCIEFRIRKTSGDIKWINMRSSRRTAENGSCTWDGFMIDITSQKSAEMELENIRHKQDIIIRILRIMQSAKVPQAIRLVLDEIGKYASLSHIYIFEKDVHNNLSCVSEWCSNDISSAAGPLQNIPQDHLQKWFDLLYQGKNIQISDIATIDPVISRTLAEQNIRSLLFIPFSFDNAHFGFIGFDDCSSNRLWKQDEIDLLTGFSQILSESMRRYRAETSVRISQQAMRMVLDNIDAYICVTDFKTNEILFVNRKIKNEIDADIEGKVCREIFREKKIPYGFLPESCSPGRNESLNGKCRWEYRDRRCKRWYECNDMVIEWIDGRWVHLGYATDITQRKAIETELVRAREKAEESDRLKSAFLANVSHEIRTPLNGIVGFIHFLNNDNLSPRLRKEYISVINNSSEQLLRLINDILDQAKIDAGQMTIHPIPFRINNLMLDTFRYFEAHLKTCNKNKIALIFDNSRLVDHCVTFIDPLKLQQVLNNLIYNAIKFTDKGYISFGYHLSGSGMLEFTVEDTGIGITPDNCEVIFERFQQIGSDKNKFYRGTGLGLPISRSLVELMGGNIKVSSATGTGSKFSFAIPYIPVAPADEKLYGKLFLDETVLKPLMDKNILVAEPLTIKGKYYEWLLTMAGASVSRVENVRQWLDYIHKNEPVDIIITGMSIIDNADSKVMEQTRSIYPDTPVILVIPRDNTKYCSAIYKSKCNMMLEDPVDYNSLLTVLMNFI